MTGANRLPQLDVLRGVAILLVLAHHAPVPLYDGSVFGPPGVALYRLGWSGVDLFFVLSGYLIGGLLFAEIRATGRLRAGRFLTRRAFKIWPLYYLYIAAAGVLLAFALGGPPPERAWAVARQVLPPALHLQNYVFTIKLHLWSLAIEEHFYLSLTLILLVLARRPRAIHALPAVAGAVAVGCLSLRLRTPVGREYNPYTYQFPTHLRIDSLAFGVFLAYLAAYHPRLRAAWTRHRGPLALAGLALIAPMAFLELRTHRFVYTYGFTLLYLGYGALLLAATATPARWFAAGPIRSLAWVGVYSYPIYLWHIDLAWSPVGWAHDRAWFGPRASPWSLLAADSIYLALAVGSGALLSRCIERPTLALRDRLFPAAVPPAVATTPAPEPTAVAVAEGTADGAVHASGAPAAGQPSGVQRRGQTWSVGDPPLRAS